MNSTSRRTFLGAVAGLAAVGITPAVAQAAARRSIPRGGIGMHLYTMRSALATDFPGTLARLAEIGYATVGVSGRHGYNATQIRAMLDAVELKAVLEHVPYQTVSNPDLLPQAIEDVRTLGGKWVVVPSLPSVLYTPAGIREAARQLNAAGARARAVGMGVLYHNHDRDHAVVEGENLYELLLHETDPDLVGFELDVYWAAKGGASGPGELFTEHPGRFPALHVKDMAPDGSFADVGSGVLDFAGMFATAERGGVRQWLVEHDSPTDAFATARNSYAYLAALKY